MTWWKIGLLSGLGFALLWNVMPPERIAKHVTFGGVDEVPRDTDTIEGYLRELSSELNASLPRRVSADSRLDTTVPGPGNRFTYYYTLLGVSSEELTEGQFQQQIAPELRQRGINIGYLDHFFKDGTAVEFRYMDEQGKPIGTLVITPEDAGF